MGQHLRPPVNLYLHPPVKGGKGGSPPFVREDVNEVDRWVEKRIKSLLGPLVSTYKGGADEVSSWFTTELRISLDFLPPFVREVSRRDGGLRR